jgi:hypothetical protein
VVWAPAGMILRKEYRESIVMWSACCTGAESPVLPQGTQGGFRGKSMLLPGSHLAARGSCQLPHLLSWSVLCSVTSLLVQTSSRDITYSSLLQEQTEQHLLSSSLVLGPVDKGCQMSPAPGQGRPGRGLKTALKQDCGRDA